MLRLTVSNIAANPETEHQTHKHAYLSGSSLIGAFMGPKTPLVMHDMPYHDDWELLQTSPHNKTQGCVTCVQQLHVKLQAKLPVKLHEKLHVSPGLAMGLFTEDSGLPESPLMLLWFGDTGTAGEAGPGCNHCTDI